MYSNGVIGVFDINPTSDDNQGFLELPINALDRSDRKFLAVAVISGATIANALDTDWLEQEPLLHGLGISVRQLCPQHM